MIELRLFLNDLRWWGLGVAIYNAVFRWLHWHDKKVTVE